jgi:hypothetical protein
LAPIELALIFVIWRLRRSVMELTTDLDSLIQQNRTNMEGLIKALSENRDGLVGLKGDLDKIITGFQDGQTQMGTVLKKLAAVFEELGLTGNTVPPSNAPVGPKKAMPVVMGSETAMAPKE